MGRHVQGGGSCPRAVGLGGTIVERRGAVNLSRRSVVS